MAPDRPPGRETGIALLAAVLVTLLVSVLTAALVLTTTSEVYTTSAFASAQQTTYAAESALEWAVASISASGADWTDIANGSVVSEFVDGVPAGGRPLGDGTSVDIDRIVSDHSGWHVYGYGRLDDLLPELNKRSECYVVVLVAPDGATAGRMKIRALSYGPRGAHSWLEAGVVRVGAGAAIDSWHR